MDRGSRIHSSIAQQMIGGNPGWWNMDNMPYFHQTPSLLPSSSSSSSSPLFTLCSQPSIFIQIPSFHESQEQPQLFKIGGLLEEGERWSHNPCQAKKMEINWESDQVSYSHTGPQVADVKHEASDTGYACEHRDEQIQASSSSWTAPFLSTSSLSSCVTSFSSSMLNFSNSKVEGSHHKPDQTYECTSVVPGSASKKARVQPPSTQTIFKVRKEKLGDKITALHQLVSPFGKTDTASVLLEAIGYIRFLQGQIEALSSPYLDNGLEHLSHCCTNGGVKDLRSRSLCLVPVSYISRVDSENEAD